jgi:hypothetical protein
MTWMEHAARMNEMKNACNILVGNLLENIPFRITGPTLEDYVKIVLRKVVWQCVYWVQLA